MPNERKGANDNCTRIAWESKSLSVKKQPSVPCPSVPSSSSIAGEESQLDFAKYKDDNLLIWRAPEQAFSQSPSSIDGRFKLVAKPDVDYVNELCCVTRGDVACAGVSHHPPKLSRSKTVDLIVSQELVA
ncbi:hypothetical protein CPAR01_06509 [Colletotrichum paranaense]|uniref:Uncharacterized protein n=1 Tax=Colletotrichum paranaense TaxID=1914294 RepID=A0ABQ9SLX0_9PEZI|nr:uncharacterized protein CPAR01_06509 [Colletotrichum paranaense]KAK1540520.1 hypothetical protein CPAR01_06509 [Colletotrichum paranaense]